MQWSEKHVEASLNTSMFSATTAMREFTVAHTTAHELLCNVKTWSGQLQRICNGFKLHSNYRTIGLEGVVVKYAFPSRY